MDKNGNYMLGTDITSYMCGSFDQPLVSIYSLLFFSTEPVESTRRRPPRVETTRSTLDVQTELLRELVEVEKRKANALEALVDYIKK